MPGEKILVVDDEAAVRALIAELLEEAGFQVSTASDGREALSRMETTTPDLVLSDIGMPGMDGHAFYAGVRARPQWDSVPFVFLSGRGEPLDVLEGKGRGVDDYLVKPFTAEALLVAVRARLSRRAQLEALRERQVAEIRNGILATLHHEFRTPLTWLSGFAEILRDSPEGLSPQQIRQAVDGILAGSARLVHLVEDLVLLVDLHSGEARRSYERLKRPLDDLPGLLQECVARMRGVADAAGVPLRMEVPERLPAVIGEPQLLGNAINRLLDNAVKFSKRHAPPVTLRAAAEGARVKIEIRDEGIGVRPEEMDKISDIFYQSDRATLEQQGLGSGLAIARGIVSLHGGTLRLTSQLGVGTIVHLDLPTL
jgi:two-component system, sensor histidine kinase and response regulator